MKKAILPAVISALFAATTAHAANLYDAEGSTIDLSGEVDAFFSTTNTNQDNTSDLYDEDGVVNSYANVQLDFTTKVTETISAMASFEVEADDGDSLAVDDAYVGFAGDFGTIKFGETGSSFALMEKTELANELDDNDVHYNDSETDGRAIRFQKTVGAVALSANYSFEQDKDYPDADGNTVAGTEDNFALSADYAINDEMNIGVAYIDEGSDVHRAGVSASYTSGPIYLAATYSINAVTSDSDYDFTTAAISGSYAIENIATVYGSFQMSDADEGYTVNDATDYKDVNYYYVGASRDITSNITAFVEFSKWEQSYDAVDIETSAGKVGVYYTF